MQGGILDKEDDAIGVVGDFVEDIQGVIIIVVVGVFDVVEEGLLVFPYPQEVFEGVVLREVELGDVAAAEAVVGEDVLAQLIDLLFAFVAVEDGDAAAVASDDVGVLGEVLLEITGGVVAAGGDDGVYFFEALYLLKVGCAAGIHFLHALDQKGDEDLVFVGVFDLGVVAGDEDGHDVVPADEGDVAGEDEADAEGIIVFGELGVAAGPDVELFFVEVVIRDGVEGFLAVFGRNQRLWW